MRLVEKPDGTTVSLEGLPGAIRDTNQLLRVTAESGASDTVRVDSQGAFRTIPLGMPDERYYLAVPEPDRDRFLGAVARDGMATRVADPGPDTDGDTSPDVIDCAPMDPELTGDRCVACERSVEICDGLDNDCDGFIDDNCETMCASDSDCRASETCLMGTCMPRSRACMSPMECGATELCTAGICTAEGMMCATMTDCALGEACSDGTCEATMCSPSIEACNSADDDCDGAIDEDCPACMMSTGCAPWDACAASRCVATTCMVAGDCMMGSECRSGECRQACMSDATCPMGNACRLGFCADQVCMVSEDCPRSETCNSGFCTPAL